MALIDNKKTDGADTAAGRKSSDRKSSDGKTADRNAGGSADRDVGHALRSVYSTTVNEDIPAELLDLLGKLS